MSYLERFIGDTRNRHQLNTRLMSFISDIGGKLAQRQFRRRNRSITPRCIRPSTAIRDSFHHRRRRNAHRWRRCDRWREKVTGANERRRLRRGGVEAIGGCFEVVWVECSCWERWYAGGVLKCAAGGGARCRCGAGWREARLPELEKKRLDLM